MGLGWSGVGAEWSSGGVGWRGILWFGGGVGFGWGWGEVWVGLGGVWMGSGWGWVGWGGVGMYWVGRHASTERDEMCVDRVGWGGIRDFGVRLISALVARVGREGMR